MNDETRMKVAQVLVKAGDYDAAYAMIKNVNTPQAHDYRTRLERRVTPPKRRGLSPIAVLLIAVLAFIVGGTISAFVFADRVVGDVYDDIVFETECDPIYLSQVYDYILSDEEVSQGYVDGIAARLDVINYDNCNELKDKRDIMMAALADLVQNPSDNGFVQALVYISSFLDGYESARVDAGIIPEARF